MNVLFVYTNIDGTHEDTYSVGVASLVAVTKQHGHEARVIIAKSRDEYSLIYKAIRDFYIDVIAFSAVSSQFRFVNEIAENVKKAYPNRITVCGGVHTTIFPKALLAATGVDIAFVGESEDAFIEFLDCLQEKKDYHHVNNIAYRSGNGIVVNPLNTPIGDLDRLPFPDKTTYPYIDTVAPYGLAPFMFSRGCPFSCTYCSNHAIAKAYGENINRPRYRSPKSSIREIEETLEMFPQIKLVWIMDDIFGLDKKWRKEFCDLYKKRIKVSFDCILRATVVDEEFVKMLKDAGCIRISFGVESGNDYVRNEIMNRRMTNDQIINAFALCNKYGLETNAINIIGTPGETEQMIWDTINLNRLIKPTSSGVNIFYPYKGTKLGDACFENGLVSEEKFKSFSLERRATVLEYPEEFKKKLEYYYNNWDILVYPNDVKRRIKHILMRNKTVWEFLRGIARIVR
jgi:radical SAM superfamily enzyme YgiQ (UPF0313 family)